MIFIFYRISCHFLLCWIVDSENSDRETEKERSISHAQLQSDRGCAVKGINSSARKLRIPLYQTLGETSSTEFRKKTHLQAITGSFYHKVHGVMSTDGCFFVLFCFFRRPGVFILGAYQKNQDKLLSVSVNMSEEETDENRANMKTRDVGGCLPADPEAAQWRGCYIGFISNNTMTSCSSSFTLMSL